MAKKEKKQKKEKELKEKKKFDFSKIFNLFKKIKLKKINISSIINNIKNFKQLKKQQKRKLLISFVVLLSIIIGAVFLIPRFTIKKIKAGKNAESVTVSNLFLYVPPDAFSYKKNFSIKTLKENSAEYQNLKTLGNFYGPIYEISPDDKKDESALKPVKIKYKIPLDLYYGDNFNNFSIIYASDDDPPIIKRLSGCEIFKDESLGTYIVQANTFHFSKFGLYVAPSPQEVSFGLKVLIDKPPSLEPDIILVPGIDNNFLGYIPNTQTINNIYGENVWSLYFPNRSIWYYKYPLLETKPKSYMDSFFGYYIQTGSNSYLEFEAERFALALKTKQNKEFDIITQGIGSLIVRYALEKHPEIKNIKSISMFSPPNRGINTVNPLYYNVIYKKSPEIIELTYGLNREEYNSLFLNISSKMELAAAYYKELLPDSSFIKKINSLNRRKDIKYYVYTGTKPDIDIHIKNTKLASFYPEFINGEGDGLVTIESAKLDGAEFYTFDLPYNKLYSNNDVLDILKNNLFSELHTVDIPDISDDTFPETKKELEEQLLEEEKMKEKKSTIYLKPTNYKNTKLLEFKEQLLYLENIKYGEIYHLDDNILLVTDKGVYDTDGRRILNKKILGSLEYKNRLYITTLDGIYAIDNSSHDFIKIRNIDFNIHDNVFYLPEIRKYIYVDYKDGMATIYENDNLIEENVMFISLKIINNNFYIVLGNKILKRTSESWSSVITKSGIEDIIKKKIGYFKDYFSRAYYMYLLTSDYKLIVYDSKNKITQILGDSDVGIFKLLENNGKLWIFDKNYITYIDLENKIFPGDYQSFTDFNIIDVINYKKDAFLLLIKKDGGYELWTTRY